MKKGEKKFTTEENKLWLRYFTKYFHIKNLTAKSHLSKSLYKSFDEYYTRYLEIQELKRNIIKELQLYEDK